MSLLLCVDVGHAHIGAAVIDPLAPEEHRLAGLHHHHTQRSSKTLRWRCADDHARRSAENARFYKGLIDTYQIKRILAELPSGGAPNSQAATDLARASTVLVAVAEVHGCAMEWYSPEEVKLAAAGRRSASKEQVMAAIGARWPQVIERFPAKEQREHVADALGVWMAGQHGALARL